MSKSHWIEFRAKRDRLLQASDWTQMPDCQLSNTKKAEWATYRQALRDLPQKWASDVDEDKVSPYTDTSVTWAYPTKPT